MRRKEALYAVIGGVVGAALVMAAGSFSPLGAQNESDANFGKITCEELEVVSVIGRVNISNAMILVKNDLPGDVLRGTILEGTPGTTLITGGRVDVTGEDDMAQVQICTDERGGLISVHGKRGSEAQVMIDVKDHGGRVAALGDGQSGVGMSIVENGGLVLVTDNDGDTKVVLGVNEYGTGMINTWDKNGYRLK